MPEPIAKLGEAATVVPMKQRQHAVVPWAEFEPYWNQLRQAMGDASQDECSKRLGYISSNVVTWRREGAPAVAMNAIRWVLGELKVEQPRKTRGPKPVTFDVDELSTLFDLIRGRGNEAERKAMIKRLAQAIAQAE